MTDHADLRVGPSVSRWHRFVAWLGRAWRWMTAVLQGPEPAPVVEQPPPPPPPPPGRLTERRRLNAPLVVPARGYIFSFQVHASFIWTSQGLTPDDLTASVQRFMPYAVRRLKALAAGHARTRPAHQAHDLEVALQADLAQQGAWRFIRGDDVEITCRPYAWVTLEERVKQAVQPFWEQLIKLDCEHDLEMQRAAYAEALSKQWLSMLTDLTGSPLADGAAQMTEKRLAEVVQGIIAERKAAAEKLTDLLTEKFRDGDSFDREEHFQTLRRHLEHQAAYDAVRTGTTSTGNGQAAAA